MASPLLSASTKYHANECQVVPWQPKRCVAVVVGTATLLASAVLMAGGAAVPQERMVRTIPATQAAAVPAPLPHRERPASSLGAAAWPFAGQSAKALENDNPTPQEQLRTVPLLATVPLIGALLLGLARFRWSRAMRTPMGAVGTVSTVVMATHSAVKVNTGGLEYVTLRHANGSSAKVYLFGADVTSYIDATGMEWLAVRPDSKMDGSKPISGGLSHCFPQFGAGAIQQHGFARNVNWRLAECSSTSATFELTPSEYTKALWDHPFRCLFTVTVGPTSLDTELVVENTGAGNEVWEFQAALHSYFAISNISQTLIGGGVHGKTYLDRLLKPPATQVETRPAITITEECDRVYLDCNDPVLKDLGRDTQLRIANHSGWKDTVVWSPYGNRDMGYEKFVCVESVLFNPAELKAGQRWVGAMSLVPEPRT